MQDKHIRRMQRQARKAGAHAQQGSTVVLYTGSVYAGLQRLSKAGSRCAGVLLHVPADYSTPTPVQLGRLYAFTDSNVKHVLPADAGYSVQLQYTQTAAVQDYTGLTVLQAFALFKQHAQGAYAVHFAQVQHSSAQRVCVLAVHRQAAGLTQQILQANKDN